MAFSLAALLGMDPDVLEEYRKARAHSGHATKIRSSSNIFARMSLSVADGCDFVMVHVHVVLERPDRPTDSFRNV